MDRDRYFWEGLHRNVQRVILRHIESTNIAYNQSKPIDMDIVTRAAKYVFSDDVFEKDWNNPVAMWLRDLMEDDNSSDDDYDERKRGPTLQQRKRIPGKNVQLTPCIPRYNAPAHRSVERV